MYVCIIETIMLLKSLYNNTCKNCATHIRTYIHTYTHTYIHTYIHTYTHTHTHTHIHTYIHTYIHIHTYTYIRTMFSIHKVYLCGARFTHPIILSTLICISCELLTSPVAMYPEDSDILGFCRGELVYPRQCVHTVRM